MINCLCRKTTLSIEEFLKLERGEITLREIRKNHRENGKIERIATKIMRNDRAKRFVTVLLASALYAKKVLAATEGKGIDPLGWKFLALIRHWAYWILLIMCIVEVVRAGISGDSKKILGIIVKFLIIFGSMYLVPELFNAIRDAF